MVDVARNFAAKITLTNEFGLVADAKRIRVPAIGAPVNSKVILNVDGEDEDAAFDAITGLINAGFHELD